MGYLSPCLDSGISIRNYTETAEVFNFTVSAHVDGGPSGGSNVHRPESEDPHRRERKFSIICPCMGSLQKNKKCLEFPLTPMGVLALGSARARPSAQPPIDMSGNFPAHVSAESPSKNLKHYNNPFCGFE